MAKGFITLENGNDFFTRWTGYDMIIEITIKELQVTVDGEVLAGWLKTRIPNENEQKGDAIFHNSKGEMVERILDLRGLTERNREFFWTALERGFRNLKDYGPEYSNLNPEVLKELLEMHNNTPKTVNLQRETQDFLFVNDDMIEKIGPGWV